MAPAQLTPWARRRRSRAPAGVIMASFFRILSIDGGGVRGILPAAVLVGLERELQRQSGRDARLADYFDLIAGTSTGGVLACLYLAPDPQDRSRPRFEAVRALELYFGRGEEIFRLPVWHRIRSLGGTLEEKYPATGIDEVLAQHLGDLRLSELLKPCLITAYDIERRRACFFTQHDARATPARDFRVRDVARATTAAPTYFECARIESATHETYPLVDGGVFANNPALCAYAEARSMAPRPTARDMLILSLGTGEARRSYPYDAARGWGSLRWARPVIDIMMSGVGETVHYQLAQIYDAVGAPEQYLRIQAELPARNAELDDVDFANLVELLEIGNRLAEQHAAELGRFAELLIAGAPAAG